jgi:hypothetical protein
MKKLLWLPVPLMIILTVISGHGDRAGADEIAGITLPDSINTGEKTCRLAGDGIRKKLFIKVYAAGLYLEKPAIDLEEVINSDQVKAMLMHFVYRRVSADKLNKAWREGFAKNTPGAGSDLKTKMADFIALFKDAAVRGDRILLAYQPGQGTTVNFNGRQLGTIPGHDFNQALMKVWFGESPADRGLKESISKALGR